MPTLSCNQQSTDQPEFNRTLHNRIQDLSMADFQSNIPDFQNLSVRGFEHLRGAQFDSKRVVRLRALRHASPSPVETALPESPLVRTAPLPRPATNTLFDGGQLLRRDFEPTIERPNPEAIENCIETPESKLSTPEFSAANLPVMQAESPSDVGVAIAEPPRKVSFGTSLEQPIRLDELWYPCWRAVGAKGDGQASFEQLLAAYREPSRRVHGLDFLLECFSTLRQWRAEVEQFDALALAIWYHDALVDPQRHDNEARSARLAAEHLAGSDAPPETIRVIRDLIIATRPGEKAQSADARLLNDIDRAVLGASPERFDRYERNLRYENAHIGDFIYRRKRIEQLQNLLSRSQVFVTDFAHAELDTPARENMRRWLQIWQQSAKPIPDESESLTLPGHTV